MNNIMLIDKMIKIRTIRNILIGISLILMSLLILIISLNINIITLSFGIIGLAFIILVNSYQSRDIEAYLVYQELINVYNESVALEQKLNHYIK